MGDILKEAIADAKAVRETALENAKMALEEAFTPQIKSMLSAKLKEEELEEDEVTVTEEEDEDEAEEGRHEEGEHDDEYDAEEGMREEDDEDEAEEGEHEEGAHDDDAEDDDKQFFVIGRFCNAYRKQAWKELVENTSECSHEELMQTAKDEMSLRCGVMVLMNPESTMPEVEETIHAIFKQKNNKPEYIVVINNSKESHSEVISRMHHVVQDRCVFYAVKIRGGVATTEQALDYGFHNIKNSYFICFEAGYPPPENFRDFLDYKLNEEMQQLL